MARKESTKNKYMEAQELFIENKILIEKGGNEARIESNKKHIWTILYEIITDPSIRKPLNEKSVNEKSAWGTKDIDTIAYVIDNFDAEKGNLENFTNMVWSRRNRGYGNTVINGKLVSLNLKAGEEDNESEIMDIIPASDNDTLPYGIEMKKDRLEDIIDIASAVNQLHQKKQSKKNIGIKLIFTGKITDICKNIIEDIDSSVILHREKSIIDGMDMDFLDFYMKEKCRNLKKIKFTNLKKWGELPVGHELVKEKDKDEEIEVPLPNKVYACFLWLSDRSKQVSGVESTVSQYKEKFNKVLKETGLKNITGKICSLYNRNMNNTEIRNELGSIAKTPLLDVVLDYFEEEQYSNVLKTDIEKIYSKIDVFMEEKCGIIRDSYLSFKKKEEEWINEYKIKYTNSYINDFIRNWKDNFSKKYDFFKEKDVKESVPEDIKLLALEEIKKKITKDKTDIEIILKSLDIEFTGNKDIYGYTTLENIIRKAHADAKSKITRAVSDDTGINSRLVGDTIYAICNSSASSIKKIVKKVQDDNLYSYYWI